MHRYDLPELSSSSHRRHPERGQALVMITLGVAFLIGVLGLVVDVGYGYYLKQVAQAAVDSAAMAATVAASANGGACSTAVLCQTGYSCPSDPTNSTDFGIACQYAKSNGFSISGNRTVTISSGTGTPPSAPGVSTSYWVTVKASQPMYLGFLSSIGLTSGNVTAEATGAIMTQGGGGCIYVMDPSLSGSYTVAGTATVNSTCGIYVNSTSSSALTAKGNSVTNANGTPIDVVGGTSINNNATVTPTPATGQIAVPDPLSALPAPTYSGCDYTGFSSSGGTYHFTTRSGVGYAVFCGGLRITGQANLTFDPGIYVLNGGGFTSTSSNTSITANGVFFYNTANGYSFGPITLAGGTSVNMTAASSGTYQGILFFQDRNITSSATNTLTGGSTGIMSGTVYMPTGNVQFNGNSTTRQTLAFVVDTFTAVGTSYFQADLTGGLTGFNSKKPYLVQ
jgi:hypothetical protein